MGTQPVVSTHDSLRPGVAPSFREMSSVFGAIGLQSFGGPAAQIALMHRVLVEERRWLDERAFLSALSFCMLLPGPEAMQLATYSGWRLHGTRGGLAAGLLFLAAGAALVLALSIFYGAYGRTPLVAALFMGVKAAVLAIVIEALVRLGRKALRGPPDWLAAAAAFVALFFFGVPFPFVIIAAAIAGYLRPSDGVPLAAAPSSGASVPLTQTLRTAAIWASGLDRAVASCRGRFRDGPRPVPTCLAFFQTRRRGFRRRLCGADLHGADDRRELRLADPRRDARRPRPRPRPPTARSFSSPNSSATPPRIASAVSRPS